MEEPVFKIGQRIMFNEDIELQGMNNDMVIVEKYDEGFVDARGMIHMTSGNLKGKIIPDKLKIEGYDTDGIAKLLYIMSSDLIESGQDAEVIIEKFENILDEIF